MQTNCHSSSVIVIVVVNENNNNKHHQILSNWWRKLPWNLKTSSYLQNPFSTIGTWIYMAGALFFACGHVNITLNKVISIYWCNSDAKSTSHPAQIKRKWPPTCRGEGCLAAVFTFVLAASLLMWSWLELFLWPKEGIFCQESEKL